MTRVSTCTMKLYLGLRYCNCCNIIQQEVWNTILEEHNCVILFPYKWDPGDVKGYLRAPMDCC